MDALSSLSTFKSTAITRMHIQRSICRKVLAFSTFLPVQTARSFLVFHILSPSGRNLLCQSQKSCTYSVHSKRSHLETVLGGRFLKLHEKSNGSCYSFFITHCKSKLKKRPISSYYSTLLQRNRAWFGRRMRGSSAVNIVYVQ